MWRLVIALPLAMALSACQTTSNHSFVPWRQANGPDNAEGAVVWLHGWCPDWNDCSTMSTPWHIEKFGDAGWDIYRVNVPPSYANHDDVGWYARSRLHANLTLPHVDELRKQGYGRVLLAGYSGGAMGVLFAGTLETNVDAILAMAPCCGVNVRGPYIQVEGFYDLLEDFKAPRLMIFFFACERNAPINIGSRSEEILREKDIIYRIFDRPEGFHGHGAGLSVLFADVFGEEIISFAAGDD